MQNGGWRYYNHAAIPTTAPHEAPDMGPVEDGSIWKIDNQTPLLARWTTEFDCGHETNWWYLIREAPFGMDEIPQKERKSVNQALKRNYVKKIDFPTYADDLYACYTSAVSRYENPDNVQTKDDFLKSYREGVEYWGGFDAETDQLIGYASVGVHDTYAEIQTAKFDLSFKTRVSDALYFTVLDHYLNECGKRYVSSGSRNINHKTGTEEYKIRRFGYKKAYCRLHIAYNPKIKQMIRILFPFRKLLLKLDGITLVHQINAVLQMEAICRSEDVL